MSVDLDFEQFRVFLEKTCGILLGSMLSKHIPNEKLKPAFGWFVLVMGVYIIGREISALS
mgnify:CR=1 FL=1